MNRPALLARALDRREPWDIVIVGGGATGVGVAVDAAARGLGVLLLEQSDFGKGTSSRSTKLVHGGVRYLEQGNLHLVMEALRERGLLRRNAPHLVHDLPFLVPCYRWWERAFYGAGLKAYNLLSGRLRFGPSRILSRGAALAHLPNLKPDGLRGGVLYHDGQFDDTRLLINLATTAVEQGATLLNYAPVISIARAGAGWLVRAVDEESGAEIEARARIVINATGVFCDQVRGLADAAAAPLVAPSQGIHLVFPGEFLPGGSALMVPRTSDGRVMFAIPWHGHTLVGTTDTPLDDVALEPAPQEREIDFLIQTAAKYFAKAPTRSDVLAVFVGIRPLVRHGNAKNTAALSRDHTIHRDPNGLLTITGGKWTTYRNMAEDCVNQAIKLARMPWRPCVTHNLKIHGCSQDVHEHDSLGIYGSDAPSIRAIVKEKPSLGEALHPSLPYCGAEVIWAARQEMARTVEDVLARRTRALFLNAHAAKAMAPAVAALMARELGRDDAWQADQVQRFASLARGYMLSS